MLPTRWSWPWLLPVVIRPPSCTNHACSATTSYVGKIWLPRSAGHGASGAPDALYSLPRRALPSRNDLFHPQTQGKIERWHQTVKNRVLLENYFLPGDLERQIGTFVDYYNNQRYHRRWGGCRPPQTASQCAKKVVSKPLNRKGRQP